LVQESIPSAPRFQPARAAKSLPGVATDIRGARSAIWSADDEACAHVVGHARADDPGDCMPLDGGEVDPFCGCAEVTSATVTRSRSGRLPLDEVVSDPKAGDPNGRLAALALLQPSVGAG
jgi:hypothetical protein